MQNIKEIETSKSGRQNMPSETFALSTEIYTQPKQYFPNVQLTNPNLYQNKPVSDSQIININDTSNLITQVYGKEPVVAYCNSCKSTKLSRCHKKCGKTSIVWTGILCFATCGLLSWLPYCICKDSQHRCTDCDYVLGYYQHPFIS